MTILGVHLLGPRRGEPFHFKFNRGSGLSKPSIIISSILIMLPLFLYLRVPIIRLIQAGTSSIPIGTEPGLSAGAAAALCDPEPGSVLSSFCHSHSVFCPA